MKGLVMILLLCSTAFSAGIGRRYTIDNLEDPSKGEENAFALNENLDDLWRFKVDRPTNATGGLSYKFVVGKTSSSTGGRTYSFTNLSDPALAEQNAIAANKEIDDLWASKVDISSITSFRKWSVDGLNDPARLAENAFFINDNIDELWREKREK